MNLRYTESALNLIGESLVDGEITKLRVTGDSMYPLIRKGDIVLVRILSPDKLSLGDIVVFRRGGEYVTHRFLEDDGMTILTKGDNSVFPDARIDKEAVFGEVFQIQHIDKVLELDNKRAHYIAAIMALFSLANANITIALETMWIKLFKNEFTRIKILVTRVISYPFRGIIRIISLFI